MSTLPDKPSELIRVALADLRKCEQDQRYTVNMDQWHFAYKGKCAVCLAGAVMAQTLGVPITITASPFTLESEHYAKLRALDEFRSGYIHIGLSRLGMESIEESIEYTYSPVIPYDTDKNQFHTDMENMAAILEKEGL